MANGYAHASEELHVLVIGAGKLWEGLNGASQTDIFCRGYWPVGRSWTEESKSSTT